MRIFYHVVAANLCYNCIYNVPNKKDSTYEHSTCSKFEGRYSDLCRLNENKCGKDGKYFTDKREPDLKCPPI
jgi:hypothetical protein